MHNVAQRRLGIPGVDKVPWGEHACVFFNHKTELLSLVLPFIKAGLEDNEHCIWITGDPLSENQACLSLEELVPDTQRYLATRQLSILSAAQWYLPSGSFDVQIVFDNWKDCQQQAEAEGFSGVRITGTPDWLRTSEEWNQFVHLEETFHKHIRLEKVLALCTYPTWVCQGNNISRTLSSHTSALLPEDAHWRRLEFR